VCFASVPAHAMRTVLPTGSTSAPIGADAVSFIVCLLTKAVLPLAETGEVSQGAQIGLRDCNGGDA
jgi:hypothetical protein